MHSVSTKKYLNIQCLQLFFNAKNGFPFKLEFIFRFLRFRMAKAMEPISDITPISNTVKKN